MVNEDSPNDYGWGAPGESRRASFRDWRGEGDCEQERCRPAEAPSRVRGLVSSVPVCLRLCIVRLVERGQ